MNDYLTLTHVSHSRQHQAIITQLIYGLTGLFKMTTGKTSGIATTSTPVR